jgi:hypothetical protein
MKLAKLMLLLFTAVPGLVQAGQNSIYWETNLFSAYHEALALHKPLVVYFSDDQCWWCNMLDLQFGSPGITASIAGEAVYVHVTLGHDDDAGNLRRLASQLNIQRGPTFAVLDVSPSAIIERGHVVVTSCDEFLRQMDRLLRSANH